MNQTTTTAGVKRATAVNRAKNAKFDRMTLAQKRIAIAKDVLKALKTRRFRAKTGVYLQTSAKVPAGLGAGGRGRPRQLNSREIKRLKLRDAP